jgi:serine protease inhibitor
MTTVSRRSVLLTALLAAAAGVRPTMAGFHVSPGLQHDPEDLQRLLTDPLGIVSSDLCQLALSSGRQDYAYAPMGLLQALVSLQQAATGKTSADFATLGFAEATASLRDIGRLLKSLQEVQDGLTAGLKLETGLFLAEQMKANSSFISRFKTAPGFDVQRLDFRKDSGVPATNAIAAWIASRTGAAPGVMAQLDADTRLYVASALAFRMAWLRRFQAADTRDGTFMQLDGKPTPARFMTLDDTLLRMEDKAFEAVDLRYEDPRFGLVLILPKARRRSRSGQVAVLASVLRRLDREGTGGWASRFKPEVFERRQTTLTLPRFEVKADLDAKALLAQTRLRPVLGRTATYGAVTAEVLQLDDFRQSVSITVTEQGTDAVAATTASVKGRGLPGIMTLDRPFIWLLRDTTTHIDLMKGFVGSAAGLLPPDAKPATKK